jgi:ADP-ribosyl-[dinitrogen reductase] hydrolase
VVSALREAERTAPEQFNEQDRGLVTIALQNAFYVLLHAGSVEAGVTSTVAQGGDTDSNGAIAGALLGAVYGRDAIPRPWRRAVLSARALPGTPHPRPSWLWPVGVQELAEALLLAGTA